MNENTNVRLALDDTTIYASEYTLSPMPFTSKNTIHEMEIKKGYMDINLDPFIEKRLKAEREKVWGMARKISVSTRSGGMEVTEIEDCFGTRSVSDALWIPVDKALEKYEAWKKKNDVEELIKSLKPQDVIAVPSPINNSVKGVMMITRLDHPIGSSCTIQGIDSDGRTVSFIRTLEDYKGLEKIGRVVETTDILGEIKKIEDEWRKNRCGS